MVIIGLLTLLLRVSYPFVKRKLFSQHMFYVLIKIKQQRLQNRNQSNDMWTISIDLWNKDFGTHWNINLQLPLSLPQNLISTNLMPCMMKILNVE